MGDKLPVSDLFYFIGQLLYTEMVRKRFSC
nr:MAG TPA: hypothetical protein [Caudoviricetes sp.]